MFDPSQPLIDVFTDATAEDTIAPPIYNESDFDIKQFRRNLKIGNFFDGNCGLVGFFFQF